MATIPEEDTQTVLEDLMEGHPDEPITRGMLRNAVLRHRMKGSVYDRWLP